MIEIDGSEGGGQLVRSALALSALTGEEFCIESIRGARPTPGLRPQHVTAVDLLAEITDADVSEFSEGTETLRFDPGPVTPGRYSVDIGTAGSITLLFDTVCPLALAIDDRLSVTARGGTDVKWSPPMAYFRRVKLPLLCRFGVVAAVDVGRRGFYPAGGGRATLSLAPGAVRAVDLAERGRLDGARIHSVASTDLEDSEVGDRQARSAADSLSEADIDVTERAVTYVASDSPGSAVLVRLDYDRTVVGGDALGEPGKPAETVGREAAETALSVHRSGAAVDSHMADQLLPVLALAGGRVRIPEITDHVESSLTLLEAFDRPVTVDRGEGLLVSETSPE